MKTNIKKRGLARGRSTAEGFTIFFAVLVSSLALAIGLAIYDLLIRELELSQTATQSQYAIYAADTGAECALYWDLNYTDNDGSAFATSSLDNPVAASLFCNNQDVVTSPVVLIPWTTEVPPRTPTSATTVFWVSLGTAQSDPCAVVTVEKTIVNPGDPSATTITSRGRNTCDNADPSRLERALEI